MRAGRVVLLALAGLALVAAAGAWVLPGALDWNRFRPEIERLASGALGRPVHIGGAITLVLLPEPALTAGDLRVDDAGDGVALRARELRLHVAFGPLLVGRLHVRSMVLQGPTLRLPWPPPPGALRSRPAWLRSAHAEIRDGTLQLGGLTVTGITAQFATDPNTGTLSGSGVASLDRRTWRITGRLATPGGDGAAGLEVSLDGEGPLQDTGGHFSGVIAADGALAGGVTGRGRDLSLLVPAPPVSWQGSGNLTAAGGLLIADELALELAGSPARGVVALRVGEDARLDLALAASRLDLDAWLRLLAHAPATALPTGIDLSAEAATLAGGILRQLRGGFDLAGGVTTVRDVSAILPGEATLTFAGDGSSGPASVPSLRGTARLIAPDLRATLLWAGAMVPGVGSNLPETALRQASLTGMVTVAPGQVVLSGLRGTLDGARAEGSAGLILGPQPLLSAELTLGALALDPWLPRPDAIVSAYPWPNLAARFAGFGVDLALHARSATWAGISLDALDLEGHFDQHGASLRRLAAEGRGARLDLAGTLAADGRLSNGKLDLAAREGAALRDLLSPDWDKQRLLRGPVEFHVNASGPPEALELHAEAALGDLRIEAQPTVNVRSARWSGPVSLRHPGAQRLLTQLGVPGVSAWLGDGSLSAAAQVSATPDQLGLQGIVLTAGALRLSGTLDMRLHGGPARVSGSIDAETLPLPWVDVRSPDPLPLSPLRDWEAAVALQAREVLLGQQRYFENARATITLRDGTLHLDGVQASLDGGVMDGSAVLEAGRDQPQLSVAGQVSGAQLTHALFGTPLDIQSGTASVRIDLAARGHSPAALLSTLSGEASATLRDGVVAGFDLTGAGSALAVGPDRREAIASAAAQGGITVFSSLDLAAKMQNGIATLTTAELLGVSGTASATGSIDLPGGALDLRLVLRPAEPPGGPSLAVSLAGSATAPRRSTDLSGFVRPLAQPAQ